MKNLFVFICMCLLTERALAEGALAPMGAGGFVGFLGTMFQPILSLIIVILMIYGVFWAYSKINKFNLKKFSNQDEKILELSRLSLISHLSLGQNKSVNVVEVNNKYLVLGVTPEKISLLREFDGVEMQLPNIPGEIAASGIIDTIRNRTEQTTREEEVDKIRSKYLRGEYVTKVS